MTWIQRLYETYNNSEEFVADYAEDPICPPSHMFVNSQIEITINKTGEFQRASRDEDKKGTRIIIPVTEGSASRSSGIAPHPLMDNLSYVAGDLGEYYENKADRSKCAERFERYAGKLKEWVDSEFCTSKVNAIYEYVTKKRMIADLSRTGIISMSTSEEVKKHEKLVVRFIVLGCGGPSEVWQDKELMDKYQEYYLSTSKQNEQKICYVTGRPSVMAESQPKGIVACNYGAKLISANDTENFTYRGRFQKSEEALSLGYDVSQKAQNVLSWLVKRQGYYVGDEKNPRVYVAWSTEGKKIPDHEQLKILISEKESRLDTQVYKEKIKETFNGYRNGFSDEDKVIFMALEAATTGRLSITYYNEMKASDYIDRIEKWYGSCCWFGRKWEDDGYKKRISVPYTRDIINYAFGTQREGDNRVSINKKAEGMQYQRILNCMLNDQPIPGDVVGGLLHRVSRPHSYTIANREAGLFTACAIIAKYYRDRGEEIKMELDLNKKDRDYLFGRLLAVYDKIEEDVFRQENRKEGKDERLTNAIRLQAKYVQRPMDGWKILEGVITPYLSRLPGQKREYYKRVISEIVSSFREEDETNMNRNLGPMYLVGYYLQRDELRNIRKDKEETEKTEEKVKEETNEHFTK